MGKKISYEHMVGNKKLKSFGSVKEDEGGVEE